MTASIKDVIAGAEYQFKFIGRFDGKGDKDLQEGSNNTYIITKDDFRARIRVIITAKGYSGSITAYMKDEGVKKKDCPVKLDKSIFGDVEGSGASKVLKIKIPEDLHLPKDAKLEYSLTGGGEPWMDIVNDAIPVGNKGYTDKNICVRVKATDDTKESSSVIYPYPIKGTLEGTIRIMGNIKCGETIKFAVTDAQDGVDFMYQIFRVKDGQPIPLTEKASINNTSYTLTKEDIGSIIRVEATDYYDRYDEALTAETAVVPKLKHDTLSLSVAVENSEGKKTVTITPVDGAEYSFNGGETYSGTYTQEFPVDENTESITVAIRYKEDDKYEISAPLTQTIDLTKELLPAPDVASLEVRVNEDKTAYEIKGGTSEEGGLEYSTDGIHYGALSEIKTTGLAANTTVTLYVRTVVTDTANASLAVVHTITTPDATAAPTIIGNETFKDETTVTIIGIGDNIYYTVDGSTPTASEKKPPYLYNDTKKITLRTTRTIKAIAVENGKIMSAVTEKTFTKETAGGNQGGTSSGGSSGGNQGGTSSGGSSGGSSATTPSKDDTKKDDTKKDETTKTDPSKTEISAEKIAEAAGTKDAEVTVKTVDANGKTVREVTAKASDLVAGKKVKVIKIDPKTGEKTLVNGISYRVAADGSLVLDDLGKGNYKVVSLAEANALTKEILRTIKPKKTKMNLTVGKKTKFKFDDALNMDNVAKITYKTDNKSIATINKDGTITAKKAGKVTIKAVVTLKNGKKKTVKMTITVKKKK